MARRRTEEGNGNTDLRAPIVSDREKREEGACAGGLKHELGRGEGIEPSVGEPGGWVGCGEEGAWASAGFQGLLPFILFFLFSFSKHFPNIILCTN